MRNNPLCILVELFRYCDQVIMKALLLTSTTVLFSASLFTSFQVNAYEVRLVGVNGNISSTVQPAIENTQTLNHKRDIALTKVQRTPSTYPAVPKNIKQNHSTAPTKHVAPPTPITNTHQPDNSRIEYGLDWRHGKININHSDLEFNGNLLKGTVQLSSENAGWRANLDIPDQEVKFDNEDWSTLLDIGNQSIQIQLDLEY